MASGDITRLGGGFDISKYKSINSYTPYSSSGFDVTFVNITGEGFICQAMHYIYLTYGYWGDISLKITVDGTDIYTGTYNGSPSSSFDFLSGISLIDFVNGDAVKSADGTAFYRDNALRTGIPTLPYLGGYPYLTPISTPIFFKSSLKITAHGTGTNTNTQYISLIGGIKA
jgi:hypothetical protein